MTYTNVAKNEMVGVPMPLLDSVGAVSEPVARAMAEGALRHSRADVSVSVTGIAGPGGGDADHPVGLVFLASARKGQPTLCERHVFAGDRTAVRLAAVERAIAMLGERAGG